MMKAEPSAHGFGPNLAFNEMGLSEHELRPVG